MSELLDPEVTEIVPVEAPPSSERTELQNELAPRLSDAQEFDLASRILADHDAAVQDRSEWESRLREWDDQYFNRVPIKTVPWPGAANFHVPLTMMGVETYKPRLVEGVLGQTPPIILVASKGADETRKDTAESFLNWQALTRLDLDEKVPASAHLFMHPGLAVAKPYWKITRTVRKLIREFPVDTELGTILEALFESGVPQKLEEVGKLAWEGEIPTKEGEPLSVSIKLKFLEDRIQALVAKEDVNEGPEVDLVDPIDLFVPAKGGPDPQRMPWFHYRLWMYENELRAKVEVGRFYADAVQELLETARPKGDQPVTDSQKATESKDIAEGVEGSGPSNVRQVQFEILEDFRRWDVDEDGQEKEIIAWVSPALSGRVLGWDYLDNVYAHGRRPIRVAKYLPIPFRFYGLSFAESIKGIQDEINSIHNQRVDYATIQNMPFYFYKASGTAPPITTPLRPGRGVPVDNPQQDIFVPRWGGSPAWASQEETVLHQYFERLSGLTDLTLGRQPNRVGATRTASGTQTLLSEAGLRFKTALMEFQTFWAGIFDDVLALNQAYLPPGVEFRVTGRRPAIMRLKDRSEIQGRFDVRLASTADNLNRQQMRSDSAILMQALLNPALVQVGIVGLKGVRRVISDFLRSYGKDPEFYLEGSAPIRTPAEELMMFAAGHYVSPVAGEDLTAHLTEHQAALADPMVPPSVKSMLSQHLQETVQLQQAQQLAQALGTRSAPMGQQAINAETGRAPQPTPTTASPPQMGMPSGG